MCDTWIALQTATRTGNVILGKNSDRPVFDCQPLVLHHRRTWPAGSQLQLEYIVLPQTEHTYTTLGSSPYWCWGYEEGINEHGVAIGNEAIFTQSLRDAVAASRAGNGPEAGLLGMDLVRLALERGKTASEAVEIIASLVEEYGQFGSGVPGMAHDKGGYDNAFLVADPEEGWVVETAGKRWVARCIREACFSISNEPTIRWDWDDGSADIVAYASQRGWWPAHCETAFDFSRAYVDPRTPRQVSHLRMMRSRQLLREQEGDITTRWMMRIARDHYEGTFLNGPYFDAADPDFQTLCMHVSAADFTWGNTASSCIAVLPKVHLDLPVFWWTPGPPCNGCYVPFFVHGSKLPEIVSRAGLAGDQITAPPEANEDQFAPDSYWWLFRRLMDKVKGSTIGSVPGRYPVRNRIVRERFDALEQTFEAQLPGVVHQATANGRVDSLVLDDFTARCVSQVVDALREMLEAFD